MLNLNLVYSKQSDLEYKIRKFPDGQQNIVIEKCKINTVGIHGVSYWKLPVIIKSRLNNWLDLELIVAAVASLRELGIKEIHLYTPYIVGGRSDRKFEGGGNNYLKDVICPVINSLKLDSVTCLDPHSDVLEACIKNFKKYSNLELVSFALENLGKHLKDFVLIAPDAGATKKIYKLANIVNYKEDIITCSKDRDTDGNLTNTTFPFHGNNEKDFIIIDDICDGGSTFINIAKKIKEYFNHEDFDGAKLPKIYLVVTHGIFSKGLGELSQYFDCIYTTNSYSSQDGPGWQKLVKTLNVF